MNYRCPKCGHEFFWMPGSGAVVRCPQGCRENPVPCPHSSFEFGTDGRVKTAVDIIGNMNPIR